MNKSIAAREIIPTQPASLSSVPLDRRRLQAYLALMLGDVCALFAGFWLSGYLYLGSAGSSLSLGLAQLILPVFLTIALYNGSYSLATLQQAAKGAMRALGALGIAAAVVVFIAFYTKSSAEFSRLMFSGGVLFAAAFMAWLRLQMRAVVVWRCGDMAINELVIDDGGPKIDLTGARVADARLLQLHPALDDPVMLDRLGELLFGADRVIVSCAPERRQIWATLLKGANVEGEVVDELVADLGAHGARIAQGHGLLRVSVGPLGLRARTAKRLLDITISLFALILLSPILLAVTVAILIEDGSPVLFAQRRVGRSNRFFDVFKFRSMRVDAGDSEGAVSAQRADSRVTFVGRFTRRTSIDELPQLLNVLLGQMSIVGPRPHALGSLAGEKMFWEIDHRYWTRHALKPGLTGLAQVRGLRGATNHEDDLSRRLEADLEYLDGWSLWRDIGIIARTLRVLVHPKAY